MKPYLLNLRLGAIQNFALASIFVAIFSEQTALRGATITGLVESPTSLTFNFSGSGDSDFIVFSLPSLMFWQFSPDESHSTNLTNGTYGLNFRVQHIGLGVPPGGQLVTIGTLSATTPFGTTFTDTKSVAHGTAFDDYSFSITVQSGWTSFVGSFSAVHREGTTAGVPDGGSTILLFVSALVGCAAVRRRLLS